MELTVENCYDLKMTRHKKKYQAAKFAKEVTNNSNGNRNGNRNDNGNGNEHLKQQVIRNQKLLMTSTEDDLKIITKASWWLSGWAFPLPDFGCPFGLLFFHHTSPNNCCLSNDVDLDTFITNVCIFHWPFVRFDHFNFHQVWFGRLFFELRAPLVFGFLYTINFGIKLNVMYGKRAVDWKRR